ncbi:uncharacterized protein LOC129334818 [Eublepharis macularius]|uniref:Uncharacterized protein LOC129334818 n=1 Tax=Eublepharis macularius TaxID=481883 RepID=A0AA97JPZ2_EUBMA|nr:uncharacterized protein LOC129334818 [Eublepharis macularius]
MVLIPEKTSVWKLMKMHAKPVKLSPPAWHLLKADTGSRRSSSTFRSEGWKIVQLPFCLSRRRDRRTSGAGVGGAAGGTASGSSSKSGAGPPDPQVTTGDEVQAWQDDSSPVAVAVEPVECGGSRARGARQRILICGHSYVFWAAHQARRTSVGSQLGLSEKAVLEWQGRRGLRWSGLLPLLFGLGCEPPHILVVHLGGNDLGMLQGRALSAQAQADLRLIAERWPGVLIIWSAMVPRLVWREAGCRQAIERARMKANRAIQKALEGGLGVYLPHPRIRAEVPGLYRGDGVHLSELGNQIFLDDLRQGLQLALDYQWGAKA